MLEAPRPVHSLRNVPSAQYENGAAILGLVVPEIARRLALPLQGMRNEHDRELRLWESVSIVMSRQGRQLSARYLDTPPDDNSPPITLDLALLAGRRQWPATFAPLIAAAAARRGVSWSSYVRYQQDWLRDSLLRTFDGLVDFEGIRKRALEFLAPDPLARALTNRIFGRSPTADQFNWVGERVPALALCAVEQPWMLPFLRIACDDKHMRPAPDPLAAFRARLFEDGIEAAAWAKLRQWGFATFERMGAAWWRPIPIARLANLLHRLGTTEVPHPAFAPLAIEAVLHRLPENHRLDFDRFPPWFMRALLVEVGKPDEGPEAPSVGASVAPAVDWFLDTHPTPDANQQRAGWPWIRERAWAHFESVQLTLVAPWPVPIEDIPFGPYVVVPIRSIAELYAEAKAMKNCLRHFEWDCPSGSMLVCSIRDRSTTESVADFVVQRKPSGWSLLEVAAPMNEPASAEMWRIAEATVASLPGSAA